MLKGEKSKEGEKICRGKEKIIKMLGFKDAFSVNNFSF